MIYQRIKDLAHSKNRTVKDVERALGYANGTLIKWKENAPSKKLIEVANYLDVSTDYLLGNTEVYVSVDKVDETLFEKESLIELASFDMYANAFILSANHFSDYDSFKKNFEKRVSNFTNIEKAYLVRVMNGTLNFITAGNGKEQIKRMEYIRKNQLDYLKK